MLFLLFVTTVVLAGIRLYGVMDNNFKAIAHVFTGFLLGYALGGAGWIVWVLLVTLCLVECYAFASKYFPALAIGNLIKKI